jgi:hypothetical protein
LSVPAQADYAELTLAADAGAWRGASDCSMTSLGGRLRLAGERQRPRIGSAPRRPALLDLEGLPTVRSDAPLPAASTDPNASSGSRRRCVQPTA